MAMQILFKDDYKEVCTYNGVINDDYKFTVEVYWNSIDKKYFWSMVQQLFDERFEEELG